MLRLTELRLPLEHAEGALRAAVLARLGLADEQLRELSVFRRAWDARKKSAVVLSYTVDITLAEGVDEADVLARLAGDRQVRVAPDTTYQFVGHAPADFAATGRPRPVVIGFGPCGIFAALILAQMGLRPIVLERGKAVRERTQDTWGLWRRGVLNPQSNVQFGEGGAGTFSDGKLWSQISDPRFLTRKVLTEFVKAGAPEEILFVAKPHIGTFRLVSMVEKMRAEIEALGGEIRFGQQVVDLHDRGRTTQRLGAGRRRAAARRPCGAGAGPQRARHLCHAAAARRVDGGQALLGGLSHRAPAKPDRPCALRPQRGPPDPGRGRLQAGAPRASNGRSVYSFCMCPGGTVVAATSEEGRVVTNGMSQYSRNERNANAGIVVGIDPQDYRQDGRRDGSAVNPLDGVAFQRFWESRAYELGGGGYVAPGQRVGDFLKRQRSSAFGSVEPSYKPGVLPADLAQPGRESLPSYVLDAIREALPAFERQIPGFALPDALLTGVETRTSSPLRIPRGPDRQSVNVAGLYPAGEGAGYAGGIMSAGVDGIETAEALGQRLLAELGLSSPSSPRA